MSNQVQIFWDPYLKAFVLEIPNPNPASVPPPIVVSPDDFQATPTKVAYFVRDPNAPLGSFLNPIPDPPSTGAGVPRSSMATPAAPALPQGTIQWQPDPSAPLGSYGNAYPYVPPAQRTPATAVPQSPAEPTPVHGHANAQASIPSEPTWQPNQADFNRLFNTVNPNPPVSDLATPAQPAVTQRTTAQASTTQAAPANPSTTTYRQRQPRTRSRSRSNGRHVRFADDTTRTRANAEAAARAHQTAQANEIETREYIDAHAPMPRLRHSPTPIPPPTTDQPSTSSPHSRSSSTASTIDPLTAQGAPIPAAPSRNPGFHDPRRSTGAVSTTPANVGQGEAEVGAYEVWPPCTVCEDRPATIRKFGIGFCDGCFGQAWAAEERRRGRSRERRT
ncbi:MAG: hypothetical protein Q9209_002754 [Squamulea sp. 1 TL-2023]